MPDSLPRSLFAPILVGAMLVCPKAAGAFEAWPRSDEHSKTAHQQLLDKSATGRIDLYFLGDSITRRWGCTDRAYADLMENWRRHFYGWNAANFGWGGDTTHNVLWRIQNGELEGVDPKVIVLQAGANDLGWRAYDEQAGAAKVDEIVRGIRAIIAECQRLAPRATILLTGVFPRADNASLAPLIAQVNKRLAGVADGVRVRFLNINDRLTGNDGELIDGVTVDGLHLSGRGYDIWAEALEPHLHEVLGERASEDLAPPPTGDPSAGD
ncbi:GDSL-type esterase/lipase family protein [Botrimarina sp.]|uniref:GDSL-type esterase/lipase family protein n=1 Tax=Botrimarina sp. TaxID=2795802 RepID=UPI0032EB0338